MICQVRAWVTFSFRNVQSSPYTSPYTPTTNMYLALCYHTIRNVQSIHTPLHTHNTHVPCSLLPQDQECPVRSIQTPLHTHNTMYFALRYLHLRVFCLVDIHVYKKTHQLGSIAVLAPLNYYPHSEKLNYTPFNTSSLQNCLVSKTWGSLHAFKMLSEVSVTMCMKFKVPETDTHRQCNIQSGHF